MQKKTSPLRLPAKHSDLWKSDFHRLPMKVGLPSKKWRKLSSLAPVLLFLFATPIKTAVALNVFPDGIVRDLLWSFLWLVSKLLWIAQSIFTYSLTISTSFSDKLPVIEVGWKVARDATNIFFIIILLIISIGTILRIPNYGNTKQLLVRLILMAVLINFSLAIGSVVIDFSNVLGIQFLTAIDKDFKVSDVIMQYLSVTEMCKPGLSSSRENFGNLSTYATVVIGNAILMVVLVFVFFVSGIMMFVRLAMLMLLLAVAPIAFVLYILPDTQKYFNKWWDTLLQYSFFFPAYTFLLYVSIKMIIEINKIVASTTVKLAPSGLGTVPPNVNFIDNVNLLVGYAIACVFLIVSLLMAKTMSLAGSGAVIGWAKTGRKYLTGALGSVATLPIRLPMQRIAGSETVKRLQDRLQQIPFVGAGAARRIDALLQRGATLGTRPKSAEQTAEFLSRQSNAQIAKTFPNLSYAQKMALLRKLPKDKRDALMASLPEDQKALALRISRGLEGEGRAGELEAAKWQSIKMSGDPKAHEESMEYFSKMSRAGKERALRTMDQKEQSDYVEKLRAAKLTDAADQSEEIVRTEFTQQQRAAYDVAGFQRLSTEEQLNRIGGLSNQAVSAFLHGKSPEERKAFIDALTRRADAVRATNPAEARLFDEQAIRMENVMADYFSPEDLRKHRVTLFNAEKDPAQIAMKWAGLTVQEQEEVMRARDPKQRASLLDKLEKHGGKLVADKAMGTMQDALTRAELAKTNAILNIRQTGADRQTMFDSLDDTDIDEVFNELKTPEEQWDYINSLSAVPDPITGKSQQDRARDRMKQTLSPDAKDDFAAYEVANKMPSKTDDEKEARAKAFVDLTEKQRVKAVRMLRGQPRADLINEVTEYEGTTGED